MTDKEIIQEYVNNFRRRIAQLQKPGIGLSCNVYPATTGGTILEFIIGHGIENDDKYKEVRPTVGSALTQINQRAFGGNLDGFAFRGTNVILEDNRIIFIKDDSPAEWSDNTAQHDLAKVLKSLRRPGS